MRNVAQQGIVNALQNGTLAAVTSSIAEDYPGSYPAVVNIDMQVNGNRPYVWTACNNCTSPTADDLVRQVVLDNLLPNGGVGPQPYLSYFVKEDGSSMSVADLQDLINNANSLNLCGLPTCFDVEIIDPLTPDATGGQDDRYYDAGPGSSPDNSDVSIITGVEYSQAPTVIARLTANVFQVSSYDPTKEIKIVQVFLSQMGTNH
jgi:hypothetical protein